jgi:NAD(P)H dehydrogenase (quinone)
MIYVPTGYSFERMRLNAELQGGSPFGAGTFAGDGTRTPSEYEKSYATHHGQLFAETVRALKLGGATRTRPFQRDV